VLALHARHAIIDTRRLKGVRGENGAGKASTSHLPHTHPMSDVECIRTRRLRSRDVLEAQRSVVTSVAHSSCHHRCHLLPRHHRCHLLPRHHRCHLLPRHHRCHLACPGCSRRPSWRLLALRRSGHDRRPAIYLERETPFHRSFIASRVAFSSHHMPPRYMPRASSARSRSALCVAPRPRPSSVCCAIARSHPPRSRHHHSRHSRHSRRSRQSLQQTAG